MISLGIHIRGHVFFDHRFEVFRGCGLAPIGVHEVLHGLFEVLVAILLVEHHHADHVQNVCPFGINEAAGDASTGAGVVDPISHG